MAAPYDYVQIVTDDDWGLVGIIPNNGVSGSRSTNPFVNINTNERMKAGTSSHNHTISVPNLTSEIQKASQIGSIRALPEATVVNRRRPITRIIGNKVQDPPITRAESTTISLHTRTVNPNTLNGIEAPESSYPHDSISISTRGGSQPRIEASDLMLFGEISNLVSESNRESRGLLAGAGNRDNILVGFGR